jgi:glycosyltransferase involved in cell wall biosynthesis
MPRVSICVPNLNTRPFLPERFETIFNQTLQDWELIVYDSYSDDGAWEYIQELAAREPRMRISQGPREGIYPGWNACIRQAKGEYVYIATSDDTMSPDCLEKLVAALDQHPDCGVAHCCLTFIDEKSRPILAGHCWDNWPTTLFLGEWNKKHHVRPRGHDAVVALGLKTAYYSITQILVRRSLFDEAGLFEKRWEPYGDLEWQMRAALTTKTVHIPEYLATWRLHPQQASQFERHVKAVRDGLYLEMANAVVQFSRNRNLPFPGGLPRRLRRFCWAEHISAYWVAETSLLEKLTVLLKSLWRNPALIMPFFQSRFRKYILRKLPDPATQVRRELHRLNLDNLSPVEPHAAKCRLPPDTPCPAAAASGLANRVKIIR